MENTLQNSIKANFSWNPPPGVTFPKFIPYSENNNTLAVPLHCIEYDLMMLFHLGWY